MCETELLYALEKTLIVLINYFLEELVKASREQLNELPFYHSFWNQTIKLSLVHTSIFTILLKTIVKW
jgi:hypothetical protein